MSSPPLVIFLPAFLAFAAVPAGYEHWTGEQFGAPERKVHKEMKDGLESETLVTWGNHLLLKTRHESGVRLYRVEGGYTLTERSAHVTYVVGSVQLDQEPIRIGEFERFLRIAVRELQIAFLQLRARLVSIEPGNSEVIMIERGRTWFLLNAKEGLSDTQNMDRRRLLLQRHSE